MAHELATGAEPDLGSVDERVERLSSSAGLRESGVRPLRQHRVGPYQMGPLLGRGGMGEVFAGFDPRLDRPVAIKRLAPDVSRREGVEEGFRAEARHAARLSHPNIVRLYDFIRIDEVDYIVSELVDGVSLSQLLQSQPTPLLPLERALDIAIAVAGALAYAHENGIVHRDVKAANVLMARNGEIKLADFGIATSALGLGPPKDANPEASLTGSPFAMSPEQTLGDYTDARSDLFSFGALMYELFSGTPPFLSADAATSLKLVRELRPLPVSELRPEVPVALSRLVDQVLQKRREDRPESALEVKAVLEQVAAALKASRAAAPAAVLERQVSVGCILLKGSRGAGLELAAQVRLMDALHAEIVRVGGTLLTGAGSHLLFCVGYPTAHENNCELLLRVVMGLTAAAGLPDHALTVGVDCGRINLMPRGQSVLATGEAIDRALGLAMHADRAGVVVTLAAQTLARRFFRFNPLVQAFNGEALGSPVYRLTEALSQDAGIEQVSSTPLRGRSRQLELLERAFHDAQQGAVVTRLIVGDAGVGKSRLLHEWRRRTWEAADLMLATYATPQAQFSPFAPLVTLFRNWLGLHAVTEDAAEQRRRSTVALEQAGLNVEELADPLQYALGIAADDNALQRLPADRRRARIIDAFATLTLELARAQLVVLSFEDLHFVDRSTLEVLRRLAESAERARLLLVLTARPEFVPSWGFAARVSQLRLDRLAPNEALLLIESLSADAPLPAKVTRRLIELGDGVPLVLEELTRAVLSDNSPRSADDQRFYYPTSLADSVMRRISELEPAREVVSVAAALGRESPVSLIRAISGVGEQEFRSRLRKLETAQLIHLRELAGEERCIFAHALVHEAVRGAIPAADSRKLHRNIVAVLERDFDDLVARTPEQFAHIYAAAGASERALDLFQRAAERAIAHSAYSEAAANLQAALSLLHGQRDHARPEVERQLRQALGPCLMATEGWSALAVADNLNRSRVLGEADAEHRELWGLWAHGIVTHDADAVRAALQGIARLPSSPDQRFIALSTEGVTCFYRGKLAAARRYLEQAVAMLPTFDGPRQLVAEDVVDLTNAKTWGCEFVVAAAMHLSWLETLCGRRPQAELVHARAESLLESLSVDDEQSELRHAFYMRIHLGLTLGDYDLYDFSQLARATGSLHRLLEIAGSRFPYYRCVALIGEARARAASGDVGAIDDLVDVYRRMKALSSRPQGHVFLTSIIAEACLEAGQLERADGLIAEALTVAALPFGAFYAPEAHRVAAECRLRAGDVAGAREALRRAKSACLALEAPLESPALLFERKIARTEATLIDHTGHVG